jgi:hypothetical protein
MNGSTAVPPPFVITFEFNVKYDEKPLLVKYVPGELYKKLVLLLLNVVFPDTFNALFKMVNPDTNNDEIFVVALFNIVVPDTYNELLIVVILFNIVIPDTFNDDVHVVLFNVVNPETNNELLIVVGVTHPISQQ